MVQSELSSISYIGNESTTIAYPIPFVFLLDDHLVVSTVDAAGVQTPLALNTDYIVTGEGNPNGGSLKTTAPVPATSKLAIERIVPVTQLVSYQEGDAFPAKSHEGALDKLTEICQQLQRIAGTGTGLPSDIGTAFRLTTASGGINAVVKRINSILGTDAFGNAVLRDSGEMLGYLGQLGTTWQNDAERQVTRGAFAGQVGVQRDNWTIYIAWSTNPGDWAPFLRFNGLVTSTNGVPGAKAIPAGDIVGTTESQVLTNKTLITPSITDPTGLDKNDVGLNQVDNVSDINKPISTAQANALFAKQDRVEKGVSGGYASLDGGAKLPMSQVPDALIGASQYQGTWNAATNTPTIPAAATGNKGWYYAVSVAGTTNINGINSWAVGDQIISNGSVWQKIVNVSAVSSVNSKTGAVVLVKADISLGNVDDTSDATKNAAIATLTNKTINGANNTLTVRLDADVANNLPVTRLNSGTGAAGDTWWCGDNSWKKPPGTGDVNGPALVADNDIAVFSGTTGKIIKTTGKQVGDVVVGPVSSVDGEVAIFSGTTGKLLGRLAQSVLTPRFPRGHLQGLTLSNNATDLINDIDITEGQCRDSTNAMDIVLASPITKRLDAAWAVGTNQGGLDTGAMADVTYHMFLIKRADTGIVDALFSASPTAPTMPASYTHSRRIGSVIRKAGGFGSFSQQGDEFLRMVPVLDINTTSQGTSGLMWPVSVPTGIKVLANIGGWAFKASTAINILLTSPDQTDNAPLATVFTIQTNSAVNAYFSWSGLLRTNTSAEIRARSDSLTSSLRLMTYGWVDRRGRDD